MRLCRPECGPWPISHFPTCPEATANATITLVGPDHDG
eukprot:CAMPEP_0182552900 /NCGR_PEP_ID=MMETSP1323-20130603/49213_1 /TAXON_ID=236787 /ORGANISM="Florenciella parvula, Strain RCC1693" /LENGTH=37 /DNA_ID= /DNA_START= /DNA_END= /DNA_ORIENTATION=